MLKKTLPFTLFLTFLTSPFLLALEDIEIQDQAVYVQAGGGTATVSVFALCAIVEMNVHRTTPIMVRKFLLVVNCIDIKELRD